MEQGLPWEGDGPGYLADQESRCEIWGSHDGDYEEYWILECDAVYSGI